MLPVLCCLQAMPSGLDGDESSVSTANLCSLLRLSLYCFSAATGSGDGNRDVLQEARHPVMQQPRQMMVQLMSRADVLEHREAFKHIVNHLLPEHLLPENAPVPGFTLAADLDSWLNAGIVDATINLL